MRDIKEIEKLVKDYEEKINTLKFYEKELKKIDTKGHGKEILAIKKNLKNPSMAHVVENDFNNLLTKIQKKEEKQRNYVKTSHHFPLELNDYYKDPEDIGKGGFARVFKAERKKDGQKVAVKVPISLDRSVGRSFIKELENWTKLDHPNIVTVFEYNILPVPYFEMELCDSCLEEISKPMKIEQAAYLVFNIAEGLKHAHNNGIIHRDIKPQNILINNGIPRVSDWGLSKVTAQNKSSTLAAFSPLYAAPEQISKRFGAKDEQTDIWQLGIIFYELITGKLPFEGDDITEISFKITSEDLIKPSKINKEAIVLDSIISKCLEKNKEKRYKTIEEIQIELSKILNIEYKKQLKKSQSVKNSKKSAFYCSELLIVNMKIGELKEALKYANSMMNYIDPSIREELNQIIVELSERIENKLEINTALVDKAEILVHMIRDN